MEALRLVLEISNRVKWKFVSDGVKSNKFIWDVSKHKLAKITKIKTFMAPILHGHNVDQNQIISTPYVANVVPPPIAQRGGTRQPGKNGAIKIGEKIITDNDTNVNYKLK